MRSPLSALLLLGSILLLLLEFASARSQKRGRVSYISQVTDPLIDTPSHRAHAHTQFNLFFTIDDGDREVKFSLEPNNDIIPPGAVVQYLGDDGTVEHEVPLVRADYRVYKGNAWVRDEAGWTYSGWARIIISKDGEEPIFEGAFSLDHDTHHVLSRTNYLKTRDAMDPMVEQGGAEFMVVFKDSDVVSPFKIQARGGHGEGIECPSDRLEFNSHPDNPVNQMILTPPKMDGVWGSLGLDSMFGDRMTGGLSRRQSTVDGITSGNSAGVNLKTSVGSTDGCPNTRMVALIGVATDCTYTGDFDSEALARANVIKQINSASDLYEKTFNITLGLSQLVISKQNCPGTPTDAAKWNVACSSNVTIENRLNLFSEWRGQRSNDTLALWTLLTTCETGSSVGLAWLGQLCQGEANTNSVDGSFVSGANVIARTATEWQVIAHEIGHTMGAVHDCTSDTCQDSSAAAASMCCPLSATVCNANGQYIMNPSTSESITSFSPCSIGNICSAFKRKSVSTSCLTSNKGVTVITEQECGNGIVETGEDCDCGGEAGCGTNSCCDGTTCKFKNNAVCDDSNEDCCKGCQYAPDTQICRASNGDCDPAEKCTGKTSSCPADVVTTDGTNCGNDLKCASGQCTSRDQQCKTVMGSMSNDTASCDSTSCVLTCSAPSLGNGLCYKMQQNFLDGTPCKGDGICKNGYCSGSSALGEVNSWILQHKSIVIGVACGVGALIIFSLLSCCWSRCRRARTPPKNLQHYNLPPNRGPGSQQQNWNNTPPYMRAPQQAGPMGQHRSFRGHGTRGSETAVGSAGYNPYTQNDSVRYA